MTSDSQASQNAIEPAIAAAAPPPRRRFQFSLIALLWLTTLVACLAALWVMYHDLRKARSELQAAREEVQKYRGESGYLDISDQKKLYARLVTIRDNKWSWRIYFPPGRRYDLHAAAVGIPEKGIPHAGFGTICNVNPGEHFIEAVKEAENDGKWNLHISITGDSRRHDLDLEASPPEQCSSTIGGCMNGNQHAVDPTAQFELIRFRYWGVPGGDPTDDSGKAKPCNGVMMWIEPAK